MYPRVLTGCPKEAQRCPKEGPKEAQRCPKEGSRGVNRVSQRGPRGVNRVSQRGPRRAMCTPRRVPGGLCAPRGVSQGGYMHPEEGPREGVYTPDIPLGAVQSGIYPS